MESNLICKICHKFLNAPITLPCGCFICNEHLSKGKKFNIFKRIISNFDRFSKKSNRKSNKMLYM